MAGFRIPNRNASSADDLPPELGRASQGLPSPGSGPCSERGAVIVAEKAVSRLWLANDLFVNPVVADA